MQILKDLGSRRTYKGSYQPLRLDTYLAILHGIVRQWNKECKFAALCVLVSSTKTTCFTGVNPAVSAMESQPGGILIDLLLTNQDSCLRVAPDIRPLTQ